MVEPGLVFAEPLLHDEAAHIARCDQAVCMLRFTLLVLSLAVFPSLRLCTRGAGVHAAAENPAINMVWHYILPAGTWQKLQPASTQQFTWSAQVSQSMQLTRVQQSKHPIAGDAIEDVAGRLKGALRAGDARVREAALLGTGEYSHEEWRVAYEQLRPHTEFAYACRVDGAIPRDLEGTVFRNGPGKYDRGGVAYKHFLDGDGLVVSIDLEPETNAAFARARFVRTAEFLEEEAAEAIMYRGTFGTRKPGGLLCNAFDLRTKNLANTNVVFWGGRVHALFEAGVPYRLDPGSLATLSVDDMEGCLPQTEGLFVTTSVNALDQISGLGGWAFTAHPHIDPHTARLCGWAWQSVAATNSISVRLAEWDDSWKVAASRQYELKDSTAAPHDFGVTASKYVMVQNRLEMDRGSYVLGLKSASNCLISRPDLPVLVHVIPRVEDVPAMVFEGPRESFEIHVCFAHDGPPIGSPSHPDAGAHIVTMYTLGWDRLAEGSFLSEWRSKDDVAPDFDKIPRTMLWRYVIDTRSGNVTRSVAPGAEDVSLDNAHVNPRFEGSAACRYVYAQITNQATTKGPPTSGPPRGYVRLDLLTGAREVWYAPSGRLFPTDPVIVEKATARGNADDTGDVWVLGMCSDMDEDGKSSLIVLDGARLAEGPVARIRLDHHVTQDLHGSFAAGFHAKNDHNV